MASFPVFQEIEGEWTATKTFEIFGLRIPVYFTSDPQLLYDFIANFQTKADDVFIVSYPKSGTTWVQEIVWQIYHNGAINSKRIEDRIPFMEEATNPKASQPDIKTLPSPRLLKSHLSHDAILKVQMRIQGVNIFTSLAIQRMPQCQVINS
ncbi:hypothetical protein OS493_004821 [Desmophyllum pertusum]|uniref:Sulfotransferase domain-containing protein n=1 Tax=Desmophyllum pertusum TaxID=174260 RepID=A0A9W9Z6X3_9CNID|nr:hypothetical protein OS493_004821 [Desmophyllum pertusum]